jgi:hypothetical protein
MKLLTVACVGFGIGIVTTIIYEKLTEGLRVYWGDYHLHHSLYGLVLIVISIILYLLHCEMITVVIIVGFSVGNIFQHTKAEGFIFINRDRDQRL